MTHPTPTAPRMIAPGRGIAGGASFISSVPISFDVSGGADGLSESSSHPVNIVSIAIAPAVTISINTNFLMSIGDSLAIMYV